MMKRSLSWKKLQTEPGATLVEYALALSLLLVVFAAAGALLLSSTKNRGTESTNVVKEASPCLPGYSASDPECF